MEKASKEVALIILETAKEKEGTIGVGKLALLLKGSGSKLIKDKEAEFKSSIFWYPVDAIENFVKQLLSMGFLETRTLGVYPNLRPVLFLTEQGKKALAEKQETLLDIVRKTKEVKLNESMELTLKIFFKTGSVEETAKERELAISTIWKHLTDLASLGMIKPEAVIQKERIQEIEKACEGCKKAAEIKEKLPEISYDEIRLVLARKISGQHGN